MANHIRGEVKFEADGEEYTFVYGSYALAALERVVGMSYTRFFQRAVDEGDWGMRDAIAAFHAGLITHHKIDEKRATEIFDIIGLEEASRITAEALQMSSPLAKVNGVRPTTASGKPS